MGRKDGSKYTKEDEISLKEFLMDEECLEALIPWTEKFNIFDILKISRTEIRHSNMLCWLLDPNENHGLGNRYLKALFRLIVNDNDRQDIFNLLLLDYNSFSVYRELMNIDILLVSQKEKTLVAIENKIGSHEHSNQLNRYRKYLEREYEDYKRIYMYLTPDGELSSDPENWAALSYRDLADELEELSINMQLSSDVELMIKNYIEVIRRDIVEDQELIEICNKIYQKHKRALDLIYENKTDNRSMVTEMFMEPLREIEKQGRIKIESSSIGTMYIVFTSSIMDNYLPSDDNYINSLGTHNIYRYFISTRDYPTIVGKCDLLGSDFDPKYTENVEKITHFFKPNDSRKDFRFKILYSTKKYKVDEENMESSSKRIVESIIKNIEQKEKEMVQMVFNEEK